LDSETKSAYAAAFHHLQRALSLAADRPLLERDERWQALLHTVTCADVLGEQAAEDAALAQLAALAETLPEKAEVRRRQAHFFAKQSEYDQAQALAQEGLALARQTGQPDAVAAALTALGTVYHLHGECSRAITFLKEAAAVPGSSVLAQAEAFVELATAYTGTKEYAAARAASGEEPVLVPGLGGSLPLYLFTDRLGAPAVICPIANHDDNQHAPDENVRAANLWQGIELFAGILAAEL